ncbi:Gldg family protein [Aurantiacibacter spongiae]|uniref:ABC-type uncharacterized transport system domain-containing protein n=1 Tax=Aurantiacibacter spongiae TaxID=2488860 RepID=A0A3N5DS87_9SPHN|nr:hypothetical protein [Aurantiacibacter spongiae]RPF72051.1 hypothetical protein EG799_10815 [Aurantiacibacter spongiae]
MKSSIPMLIVQSRCVPDLAGLVAAALLAFGGGSAAAQDVVIGAPVEEAEVAPPSLGLMGTIPIYWGEAAGLEEMLAGTARPHWARPVIARDFTLQPVDYLSGQALAGFDRLLLAQPRGLTAEENVALDAWVRGGGRLLLFADPMMTGESRFAIGDRRRPQDVALLSPILRHWGLELLFDPEQDGEMAMREFAGTNIPVALSGTFAVHGSDFARCALFAADMVARCTVGAGEALIVADAALLDLDGPHDGAPAALRRLLAEGLGISRDNGDGSATAGAKGARNRPRDPHSMAQVRRAESP